MKKYLLLLFISVLITPFAVQAQSLSGLQNQISQLFVRPSNIYTIPLEFNGLLSLVQAPLSTSGINVSKTFTQNGVYPLSIGKPIYGLQITADTYLSSSASLVRVILTDSAGNEYSVFEGSPITFGQGTFSINNYCEETCVLNRIIPTSLKIEVLNGSVTIKSISTIDSVNKLKLSSGDTPTTFAPKLKTQQVTSKISQINTLNAQKNLKWTAGLSTVCQMSYAQKKQLFKDSKGVVPDYLPNLQGFDCYKGGIFSLNVGSVASKSFTPKDATTTVTLPDSYDWRNVNGENWMTSVVNQWIGTCSEFATVGTFESQINLYFNQHLDLDLSEQMYTDCQHGTSPIVDFSIAKQTCMDLGNWNTAFCKEVYTGLVDEACSPYVQRDIFCNGQYQSTQEDRCCSSSYLCNDWTGRTWKNTDFREYSIPPYYGHLGTELIDSTDRIKELLITEGPLKATINFGYMQPGGTGNHSMVLVGFEAPNKWIFKNSWGSNWGDLGYATVTTPNLDFFAVLAVPIGPFIPPTNHSYWPTGFNGTVSVVDKDHDNYCSWGISDQPPVGSIVPSSCKKDPATNKYIKDCNDSNAALGPFKSSTDFTCSNIIVPPITPSPTITPSASIIDSSSSVKFNFSFPSNTVRASLYLYCPSGVTTGASPEVCNKFIDVTSASLWSGSFYNSTSQVQNVVPNYYVYLSTNPNYAVGVSSQVSVKPIPTPILPVPPSSSSSYLPPSNTSSINENMSFTASIWNAIQQYFDSWTKLWQ
jgi:C1A family cysteine protease